MPKWKVSDGPAPKFDRGRRLPAPPSDAPGVLHGLISFCLESGIHLWVQLTGKLVRKSEAPWLAGPLGGRERIGTGIYERVAKAERSADSHAARRWTNRTL